MNFIVQPLFHNVKNRYHMNLQLALCLMVITNEMLIYEVLYEAKSYVHLQICVNSTKDNS